MRDRKRKTIQQYRRALFAQMTRQQRIFYRVMYRQALNEGQHGAHIKNLLYEQMANKLIHQRRDALQKVS